MNKIMRLGTVSVNAVDDELEYDITDKLTEMNVEYTKSFTQDPMRKYKYIKITIVN